MNEPQREWAAPEGWGPPAPSAHPSGAPDGGSPPAYGGAPPYGAPAGAAPGPAPYGGWGPRPPELKPGVVPLRPLGLGELLDGAVGILRRYPKPALGLSALVALASTLINILLVLTAFDPFLSLDQATLENGDVEQLDGAIGGAIAGGGLSAVVTLLSSVVLSGVITVVVGKAVLGQPLTPGDAWRAARPHLLKLVGLALLVGLVVGLVGLVLAGIGVGLIAAGGAPAALIGVPLILAGVAGAVYLYIRLSLAPCALVLERIGVRSSMSRSSVLAKGDWWRIFGILVLTSIIASSIGFVLQLPFQAAGFAGAFSGATLSDTALVLSSIGSGLALLLTAPFSAGVQALLYVDRRMRAEGLDVTLAAAATGAGPAGSL